MHRRQALKFKLGKLLALAPALALLAAACSPVAAPTSTTSGSGPTSAPATLAPADTAAATSTPTSPTPAALVVPSGDLRFVLASSGNSAHYTVTEQLANRNFPSDAIGTTNQISGQLIVSPQGKIDASLSDFKVDLANLTSDSRGRDGFIQRNTLETGQFPSAEFVPAS